MAEQKWQADIGLYGLAVMGQNFALNIASKGFNIAVCNRSPSKVDSTVERAKKEKLDDKLKGYKKSDTDGLKDFIQAIKKPRAVIILVKAGKPVDSTIELLRDAMEDGDIIIDGGNEWFENTERREKLCNNLIKKDENTKDEDILKEDKTFNLDVLKKVDDSKPYLYYMGMGISGGETGARYGPSLMPGGSIFAYKTVEKIVLAAAAKSEDGTVCCKYLGRGGSGNYIKMVHNGIEYGDMQLIAEAYDILKNIVGYNNDEIGKVFDSWNNKKDIDLKLGGNDNKGELKSYLIEISGDIFKKKDDIVEGKENYLVDQVMDKTGQKGTGRWTVQEAAERGIAAPTISAALTARNISALKTERIEASKSFEAPPISIIPKDQQNEFVGQVRKALYASKICSYTQGMNIIRQMAKDKGWDKDDTWDIGGIASIWKEGCIIRSIFLDDITDAYKSYQEKEKKVLPSLLMSDKFNKAIKDSEKAWRNVVITAIQNGIATPAFSASLAYYDSYRRDRLPANLTQSQRDYFGAHTYQRLDGKPGNDKDGNTLFIHSEWTKSNEKHSQYGGK